MIASPVALQAAKSYVMSMMFGAQHIAVTMFLIGYAQGYCSSFTATVQYFGANWWAGLVGLVFGAGPYYRAREGAVKAQQSQGATP